MDLGDGVSIEPTKMTWSGPSDQDIFLDGQQIGLLLREPDGWRGCTWPRGQQYTPTFDRAQDAVQAVVDDYRSWGAK